VDTSQVGGVRSLLSPVVEEPGREEACTDNDDLIFPHPSSESQEVAGEARVSPVPDTKEMEKLVQMCERLLKEGVALPQEDTESLHTLTERLDKLMQPRHTRAPGELCEDIKSKPLPVPKLIGIANLPGKHEAQQESVSPRDLSPTGSVSVSPRDVPWLA